MGRGDEHVRGTPVGVKTQLSLLALVLLSVFLAFPALLAPVLKVDETFTITTRLVLILAGAGSWAVASLLGSSAWLSLCLSLAVAQALWLASEKGYVEPTVVVPVAAPLAVAAVLSALPCSIYDCLLAAAGLGVAHWTRFVAKGSPEEVTVLAAVIASLVLTSPGFLGYDLAKGMSPIMGYHVIGPAALVSFVLAAQKGSLPHVVIGFLSVALVFAFHLSSRKPDVSLWSRKNSRASQMLATALFTSLAIIVSNKSPTTVFRGLAAVTLVLAGCSVSVLVTSLLGYTAQVWGPVRSGEVQMVTLDYLALLAYFVVPLLYVLYLAWSKFVPPLPQIPIQFLPVLMERLPLLQAAVLALALVAAQDAFLSSASSSLWTHWLVPTFTLGQLDTRKVALVARFADMLEQTSARDLVETVESSNLKPLNIFINARDAMVHPNQIMALRAAGHVIGVETTSTPFTAPTRAAEDVTHAVRAAEKRAYVPSPKWYTAADGYRSPWALMRASDHGLRHVAPVMSVQLGNNAGVELVGLLDPWCRGGVVKVEMGVRGPINLSSTLSDLRQHMETGKYTPAALDEVCKDVQEMKL